MKSNFKGCVHKGCSRNYPGVATFFSDPSTPRTHMESEPPRPPGHISALINLPHYGSNTPWPPGQVTSPPLRHIVNKTPSTHRTKKCLRPPPPQDNFWNSPNDRLGYNFKGCVHNYRPEYNFKGSVHNYRPKYYENGQTMSNLIQTSTQGSSCNSSQLYMMQARYINKLTCVNMCWHTNTRTGKVNVFDIG